MLSKHVSHLITLKLVIWNCQNIIIICSLGLIGQNIQVSGFQTSGNKNAVKAYRNMAGRARLFKGLALIHNRPGNVDREKRGFPACS